MQMLCLESLTHSLHAVSFQMLAESLCSILLLEETSPRQVFTEFILARKAALQEIFHPCQHGEVFVFPLLTASALLLPIVRQLIITKHNISTGESVCLRKFLGS